jgi:hypothetical protein
VSYSLGQGALTTAQANRDLGWTKAKLKKYWDARAQACTEFGDEGECLAQVAKHVPVTIAGLGAHHSSLGVDSTARDIVGATTIVAGLIASPDATLRRHGPPLVAAADRHVIGPMVDKLGEAMAPYLIKYMMPPLAVLYVLSGVSAYFSFKSAKKLQANPSRRRRKRRTSRR